MPGTTHSELPYLPFVGRAAEWAALRLAMERLNEGVGGVIALTGPSGCGKSHLAGATEEEARRRDILVASGRSFPLERDLPYYLFAEALEALLDGRSAQELMAVTRGVPELALVCPTLRGTLVPDEKGTPAGGDVTDPVVRHRLYREFPGFVSRLSGGRPLLVVFEDLHQADPSSLSLLHFVARGARVDGILFLLTWRDSSTDRTSVLRSLPGLEEHRLTPLTREDVRELVSRGFDLQPASVEGFASRLHAWSGGRPLLVREILTAMVADGTLARSGGRWTGWSTDRSNPPACAVPAVRETLGDPGSAYVRALGAIAIAGNDASPTLLAAACEASPEEVLATLAPAVRDGIVKEEREASGTVFRFRDEVIPAVLLEDMGPSLQRILHERVAAAIHEGLERGRPDRDVRWADALARHLLGADESIRLDDDTQLLTAAGRRALARHRNRQAAAYLEEALRRLRRSPGASDSRPGELALLIDAARARRRLGDHPEAAALLEAGDALARRAPAPEMEAALDAELGALEYARGRRSEAEACWDRGLARARAAGATSIQSELQRGLARCHRETGRPETAREHCEEALAVARDSGRVGDLAMTHLEGLLLDLWTGRMQSARTQGERILALAEHGVPAGGTGSRVSTDRQLDSREGTDPPTPIVGYLAHLGLALVDGFAGDPEAAEGHVNEARRLAHDLRAPTLHLVLAEVAIEHAAGRGRWDEALDLGEEALRSARVLRRRDLLPRLLAQTGILHLGRGRSDLARAYVEEAAALLGEHAELGTSDLLSEAAVCAGRAALHLAEGRYSDALRETERGMETLDETPAYRIWGVQYLLPLMGEAALLLRDLDRAAEVAARIRRDARVVSHRLGLVWARACEALIEWLRGDPQEGARRMHETLVELEALSDVPHAARLRRQLAGRLAELGRREAALRELRQAHEALTEIGAESEVQKVRGQFREVGARPPPMRAGGGAAGLTPRELEVARRVGERKSNKAIGRELDISDRTVGTHLTNIFRKLEVPSRQHLGDLVREGLLLPPRAQPDRKD